MYKPDKRRESTLARYGLTPGEYDARLLAQGGVCAICKEFAPDSLGRMSVDHDHLTEKVRGILCSNCNTALGKMKDSPSRLRAAADYLVEAA